MAPKTGDDLLSLRHFKVSKSPKPLAALDIFPAVSRAVDKTVNILNVFIFIIWGLDLHYGLLKKNRRLATVLLDHWI